MASGGKGSADADLSSADFLDQRVVNVGMALTVEESVEPAVIVTGGVTEALAAGAQIVTEGFAVFSGHGAA